MACVADADPDTAWADLERHAEALVTVREFAERSGALRVVALLDDGAGRTAAVIDAHAGGSLTIGDGETAAEVPPESLEGVEPRPLRPLKPLPPSAWHMHPERGEVMAPIGAIAALGEGLLELARALGGRSVASADFAMADGATATIAAREGDPLILAVGDEQFELPLAGAG